ncbi:protein translocase subunit SecD [Thiohalophilus thiocyanatoxydans]|uniref:Protein translocase subunit SecD n=1 Tax=Thiohalophilus thiocyanatoxydans TaxID=381308 RepID=A0A4R8ILN8_9GAMM|nr:protein translocase subunit SecD [Thiohalophilus thiocyanatoxydans]TDY01722.1 preprotein translocase subunit SecD [Thiohalophilus thiocyanatoxydans]
MLNQYPLWKYLLILLILVTGLVYALPNVYGTDPSIQISATGEGQVDSAAHHRVRELLEGNDIPYSRITLDEQGMLVRFADVDEQLKANDILRSEMGDDYVAAMNLAPAAPSWLTGLGALPMYLGLDLRGGLHFLMEVDTDTVMEQTYEDMSNEMRTILREAKVRYRSVTQKDGAVELRFSSDEEREAADTAISAERRDLQLIEQERNGAYYLVASLADSAITEIKKAAVKQNITTLRNRINELGVAEPIVQRQGEERVVIQLPGVQDSAQVKTVISATATLEFRLVDVENDVREAQRGRVPFGSRLYEERNGDPILLKKRVIITGERITNATAGFDEESGSPAVFVNLDGAGASRMASVTKKNIGQPMAVVFIEYKPEITHEDGEEKVVTRKVEEVINVATIRGVLSKRFQITGLEPNESSELALLLRAGALAAPIRIIEERTIGPSMGQDNINQGTSSVLIGMILVLAFMAFWYRGFGLVANVALVTNLVLIVAVLSMLQATLTLPGIAGIVLTVGMAVDANVLIFERIREELQNGNSPQASISSGYAKALSTIADANITTLIAAVVLFVFGTGPIKGFAITLSIGIITSMFTAIMGTRAIVNLAVAGKKLRKLSI